MCFVTPRNREMQSTSVCACVRHACVWMIYFHHYDNESGPSCPISKQICRRKFHKSESMLIKLEATSRMLTWTTKLRLSQSKNIFTVQFVLDIILFLTVAKLIWSLEVNRSTSLNQRQVNRLVIGICSLIITHPSGTSKHTNSKINFQY